MTPEQLHGSEVLARFEGVKETKEFLHITGSPAPCYYTTNGLFRSRTFTVPDKSFKEFCENAKYHTSYDWLMRVWVKFMELDIDNTDVYDKHIERCHSIGQSILGASISESFTEMVRVVEWYNSIKEK